MAKGRGKGEFEIYQRKIRNREAGSEQTKTSVTKLYLTHSTKTSTLGCGFNFTNSFSKELENNKCISGNGIQMSRVIKTTSAANMSRYRMQLW